MDIMALLKNEEIVYKFLMLFMLLSGLTILFYLLGLVVDLVIPTLASILIVVEYILLFILSLMVYSNANAENTLGKKMRLLTHLLLVLMALFPVFIGLMGTLLSAGLYFVLPLGSDASALIQGFMIVMFLTVLGVGLLISVTFYLKREDRNLWQF